MDIITQARLFVDRIEFVTEMFTSCLDFEKTSSNDKLVVSFKMPIGTEIIIYDSRSVYKEGDKSLKLTIEDSKIDRLKTFLESKSEKFFYKEKHEYGVNRILFWQMDNGTMIDFNSLEVTSS